MKANIILMILTFVAFGASAQTASNSGNTGIARPVVGANWHEGAKGATAERIHKSVKTDGKYEIKADGVMYDMIVDVVEHEEYQVLFGQYAEWNRNWVDLEAGEKVFIFYKKGSATAQFVESKLKGDYNNFLERYLENPTFSAKLPLTLAKCGNDIYDCRFIEKVITDVIVKKEIEYVPIEVQADPTTVAYKKPAPFVQRDTVYQTVVVQQQIVQQQQPASNNIIQPAGIITPNNNAAYNYQPQACNSCGPQTVVVKNKPNWVDYTNLGLNLLDLGVDVYDTFGGNGGGSGMNYYMNNPGTTITLGNGSGTGTTTTTGGTGTTTSGGIISF